MASKKKADKREQTIVVTATFSYVLKGDECLMPGEIERIQPFIAKNNILLGKTPDDISNIKDVKVFERNE